MHAPRTLHVVHDLANGAHLRVREGVGERRPQFAREHAPILETPAAGGIARDLVGLAMQELHAEQFLEGQARAPVYRLGHTRGAMHHAQRLAQRRHRGLLEQRRRQRLGHKGQQRIEVLLYHGAQQTHRQPLGAGIHRQHTSLGRTLLVGAKVHELARLHPAAVEEAHGPGTQQPVALVDRAVEERLPRPRDLEHARGVLDDRLEHA